MRKSRLFMLAAVQFFPDVGQDLISFAEKIDAPVVSSLMGLGAFPNGHPLHLWVNRYARSF